MYISTGEFSNQILICDNKMMKHIDKASLASLPSRIEYITDFLEFGSEDAQCLLDAAPILGPLVQSVVDAVYVKLFSYSITKTAFIPKHKRQQISLDDEEIKIRKDFLSRWFVKLVTADYGDPKTWEYLDRVGARHAPKRDGDQPLIDYMHCAILLGWVVDLLIPAVIRHDGMDENRKIKLLTALNKIVWIQNDFFAKHYMKTSP